MREDEAYTRFSSQPHLVDMDADIERILAERERQHESDDRATHTTA